VLRGTEENDSLLAGEYGEDEVYGSGANDHVEGGACDDKLYGAGRGETEWREKMEMTCSTRALATILWVCFLRRGCQRRIQR
jgi:RTX calcium-binding nonapeptide repeat (4 copies)